MTHPVLIDLFCGAGGSGMGYREAGFHIVGLDIADQPRYPGDFIQTDVMKLRRLDKFARLVNAVAIHASPPCQAYSNAQKIQGREHPDLVAPVRDALRATGLPYVIENVVGSPLRDPIMLCGAMFPELRVYRHRLFETSFPVAVPGHPEHVAPLRKMGRRPLPGEFVHVVGNFSGAAYAREAMGISWMTRDELREAIPPRYTRHIGQELRWHLVKTQERAA